MKSIIDTKKIFTMLFFLSLILILPAKEEEITPESNLSEPTEDFSLPVNILKYGDSIRLRFTNIANTTLHTQKNNYVHPKASGNQIISGYFDVNNYKNYQQGQYDDEWIVLGPYPLHQDYKKGDAVKGGDIIRLLNPKTEKKLHYFYNERNKAPGSAFLLEVCGFAKSSPSNNWQINIIGNTNEQNEIIYNETLFTVQALNELDKKYLTVSNAKFSVSNTKQQLVGLTQNPNNNWFIELPDQQPQTAPKLEIEELEIEKKAEEEKQKKAEEIINTMWAINGFDKPLFRNNINENNKTGGSWSYITSDGLDVKIINDIAVSAQGSMWVIDNLNQLYFQQRKNTPWIKIANNITDNSSQFTDIAVGTNMPKGQNLSVWAIGKDQKLYRRENTNSANLQGSNWSVIEFRGKLKNEFPKQISLSPDGNLSVVTTLKNIYLLQSTTNSWIEITKLGLNLAEKITQIKLGPNNTAWSLNKNQKIYFIENILQQGQSWQEITDGYLYEIAVSANGAVFGINSNGTLYQRANTQTNPSGAGWIKIKDNVIKITISSNDIPICLQRGASSFYNTSAGKFSKFRGSKISFLNSSNEWEPITLEGIQPIEIQEITLNSLGQLFALDRFYNSYYRKNITKKNLMGDKWIKVSSYLPLTIELGEDENSSSLLSTNIINAPKQTKINITSTNPHGQIQQINIKQQTIQFEADLGLECSLSFFNNKYITHFFDEDQNMWFPDNQEKELKQIAIQTLEDRHIVWGIDQNNNVFVKTNITLQKPQGDNWQPIAEKKMKQIFVSPNGTIWGLSNEPHHKYTQNFWLYYRTGVNEKSPTGSSWVTLNSAVQKLPNTAARFLRYGDKISLCTALNRLMQKTKAGEFIDTQNLLAFANGATSKNSQIIEIINPLNITDDSLVKYNDPIILKTSENKFLSIVADLFLYTEAMQQSATQFSFGKISKNVKGNLIEYGTRVKIQTNNKFLVNDQSLLNSNLILKGDTNTNNGLFLVLKPINNKIAIEQNEIDTIETSATLILQQINQALLKVFSTTAQPGSQAKNSFAQILVTLFNNQKIIPATILRKILQTSISQQKVQLLTQEQRDYILANMINQLQEDANLKFQPLLTTIISKFNELLATINLPSQAIIKFAQQAFYNKELMNNTEINILIKLMTNLYQNAIFFTGTEKNNLKTMINSLGGTISTTNQITAQTQPTIQATQSSSTLPKLQTEQKREFPKQKASTQKEQQKRQQARTNLQRRSEGIVETTV